MTGTIELNDQNFDTEVLSSTEPFIVDFWAEWCGPCKAVAPSIEALSEEMKDQVKFGKLNVDTSPEIAGKYGPHVGVVALLERS